MIRLTAASLRKSRMPETTKAARAFSLTILWAALYFDRSNVGGGKTAQNFGR
jgi:hypothetical protein